MRTSIRYKILLVTGVVLLAAVGSHLYLATSLFTRDKLAYVYDLNASTVALLAEQASATLRVLAKEARLFAREMTAGEVEPAAQAELARELFDAEEDIVQIALFEPRDGSYVRVFTFVSPQALGPLGLRARDLDALELRRILPLSAIGRSSTYYVTNTSLPPDAAMLTLAFGVGGQRVVVVTFRHERLLRSIAASKLRRAMITDEHGVVVAHPDAAMVIERRDLSAHPLVQAALKASVEQGVLEFGEGEEARLGAFGRVGIGRLIVLSEIPKAQALQATTQLAHRSSLFAVAILLAAFLASLLLARLITAPLRRLRAATEEIGQGRFDIRLNVASKDEVGDLARAFEHMAAQIKETQAQLVHSEKMAAFGQLGAGITHEVKNPITALVGFAQLAQKKVADTPKVLELLKIIETEGLRCRDLLSNFLRFARTSGEGWERLDVAALLEQSARMLRHQLAIHNVHLEMQVADDLPAILGNSGELQQVLLNLCINAQQAMPDGGKVVLSAERDTSGGVALRVTDNGPGVPPEIRDRIFEPFFTTKKSGEGTGLGLSITFNLVRAHKGVLTLESELGRGTTFIIKLPPASLPEVAKTG